MNDHIQPELLERFVDGALGEATGAHVARHLDACPACANLARELDPLSPLFAAMPDPEVPADLVDAILAADAGTPPPWAEITVGSTLLAVASMLGLALLEPSTVWSRLTTLVDVGGSFSAYVLASPWMLSSLTLSALVLAGAGLTAARTSHRALGGPR